jgi:hypothetical protein
MVFCYMVLSALLLPLPPLLLLLMLCRPSAAVAVFVCCCPQKRVDIMGAEVGYFHHFHKGVDWVFVDHPSYPRPGGLYADEHGVYGDNQVGGRGGSSLFGRGVGAMGGSSERRQGGSSACRQAVGRGGLGAKGWQQ